MTHQQRVGLAAMADRFPAAELMRLSSLAERAGFDGTVLSDHFQPWLARHGHAAHSWSLAGALGQAGRGPLGIAAVTAGYRLHPAVLAQAAATLNDLYPGRFWCALGAGEALNEHVVGQYWPEAAERVRQMFEALEVVTKLFATLGDAPGSRRTTARHRGSSFTVETSSLWAENPTPPPVLIATSGPATARRAGRSADGLMTIATTPERAGLLRERFLTGVAEAGRDPDTVRTVLRLDASWAADEETALRQAIEEWPLPAVRFPRSDVRSPQDMEQLVRGIGAEDFEGRMLVSADTDAHVRAIQAYLDLGYDEVYLHNAGTDQAGWIAHVGAEVLPRLRLRGTGHDSTPSARQHAQDLPHAPGPTPKEQDNDDDRTRPRLQGLRRAV